MDFSSEFENTGYDYSNATVTLAVDIVYSDDDADEEGNPKTELEKAFAHKLLFGKHKNKSLGEMLASRDRRSYLRYLLDWDDLREQTRSAIDMVLGYYNNENVKRKKAKK